MRVIKDFRDFQAQCMEIYADYTGLTKFQNYKKYMATKCMFGNYYQYVTGKIDINQLKEASNKYFEICNFQDAAYFDKIKDKVIAAMRGQRKLLAMI